ncbi:MAG: glycosyltransferase [Candidatus Krumholzibacteria bacterium]|nr:glycosyltransferase [Candidatus Krumholzibacteria bacterium]
MKEHAKILIVTSTLTGGGAGNHILSLCRYLRSVSIDPFVLTIAARRQELEERLESEGVPILRHPLRSLIGILSRKYRSGLRRTVESVDPDIVHAHQYHGEMTARVAARYTRAPLVVTRHSSGLEFSGTRRALARIAAGRIGAAIAVSGDAAREAVSTGVPAAKISVIPNGVDTLRFRALDGPEKAARKREILGEYFPGDCPPDTVLVGAAGALKPVKNHALFLRVASRAVRADPSLRERLRFIVAGEGELRGELESQIASAGLAGHVALPGYIDGLDDLLPCLDIFLVTSRSEGVPIALLEAMSSGAACVAGDVGDIAEILGDAGLVMRPGDEDGFVEAVGRLAADGAGRTEIGRRARVRALERFDVEIWGARTVSVYEKLLGGAWGEHASRRRAIPR